MIQKVESAITDYDMLQAGDHIVLGLSGGMDSMALLYALLALSDNYPITAVHINHGIRGDDARRDESFARKICQNLGIAFKAYHFDVPAIAKEKKISLEEAGRMVRYQAFSRTAQKYPKSKIAVAHHLNDQGETVLMRFIRGTGTMGLGGIPPVRDNIIRPMIHCTKKEIRDYVAENKIPYVEDSTNTYKDYTRNKIRLECIPYIERELNPNFLAAMDKTSRIAQSEEDFLRTAAKQAYEQCVQAQGEQIVIDKESFITFHPALQYRVLRMALEQISGSLRDVTYKHIEILHGLLHKPTGAAISLPDGFYAYVRYGSLVIEPKKNAEPFEILLSQDDFTFVPALGKFVSLSYENPAGKLNFLNTCTMVFGCDRIIDNLYLRSRKPGDRIYISSIGGRKKIKDYFIDHKIPRNKRDQIPLLAFGQEVLWILDDKGIVSDRYKEKGGPGEIKLYVQLWEALK